MWRQQIGDALAGRMRILADELVVTRAALIPVMPLDRAVLDPAYRHLSSALTSMESALHHLDCWQRGAEE